MKKSPRNKTIDTGISEGREYLEKCLKLEDIEAGQTDLTDCIVCADMFDVCRLIPAESADLMILDPPYNLTKDYDSESFLKRKPQEYEECVKKWLDATKHILKKGGTVYVCSDWESSLIIGRVLSEYYTVRNRITWQREKGRGARAN